MRCTKCSFISFDDLSACAKCASDLSHLSKELNGTCTETRQEFFLGSAIQAPGLDEDNFSDSQMLPPINQSDMNFDDTSTGGFSPLSASSSDATGYDFDDSVGIASEDDVAIELGDIMPIDFEQLDSDSVLAGGTLEHNESLNFDNFNFDLDKTENVSLATDKEVDLDLTADFVESGEHFQFDGDLSDIDIGDLSQDLPVVLADAESSPDQALSDVPDKFSENEDFDFDPELFEQLADTSNSFDETTSLNPDVGLNETQISFLSAGDEQLAPLDLDESLVAELAGPSSPDLSREFALDYSDEHSASGDFELDAALVAELASGDEVVAANGTENISPATENLSADTVEFESPLEFAHAATENEPLSFGQIEDLTGDFPSLHEEDDTVLSGLDLADIDVSDLLDPSDKTPAVAADDGLNQPGDWSVESAPRSASVDDTIREEAGSRESDQLDINIGDEVALEFDEELLSEESEGLDDTTNSGSDLDATTGEINLPEGSTPRDFSSSFLDDTFRDGESGDASFVLTEEELADDILDDELVLDDAAMEEDLPVDIDALALDADFEAYLNKTAKTDNLPEIELISDDDDEDGPPDLPS